MIVLVFVEECICDVRVLLLDVGNVSRKYVFVCIFFEILFCQLLHSFEFVVIGLIQADVTKILKVTIHVTLNVLHVVVLTLSAQQVHVVGQMSCLIIVFDPILAPLVLRLYLGKCPVVGEVALVVFE